MPRPSMSSYCPPNPWLPRKKIDTTFNKIFLDGKLKTIISSTVCKKLRSAAEKVGEDHLGFHPDDIGIHSIRLVASMVMYPEKVPTFTFMLIDRWSSYAFLRYIRKKVEQSPTTSLVTCSNTIPFSPQPTILHKYPATTQEAAKTPYFRNRTFRWSRCTAGAFCHLRVGGRQASDILVRGCLRLKGVGQRGDLF